jgi:hypothetical protein
LTFELKEPSHFLLFQQARKLLQCGRLEAKEKEKRPGIVEEERTEEEKEEKAEEEEGAAGSGAASEAVSSRSKELWSRSKRHENE